MEFSLAAIIINIEKEAHNFKGKKPALLLKQLFVLAYAEEGNYNLNI